MAIILALMNLWALLTLDEGCWILSTFGSTEILWYCCWCSAGWPELISEANLFIFILFGDVLEFELFWVIVIWLTCMCLQMHCSQRCSKLGFFLRHCSCFLEWNSYFGWCERDSVFIVLNWVFLLKHCSWLLAWHTHSSWRNTSWDDSCWGLQMVYRDVTCLTLCGVRCSFFCKNL